MWQSAFFSSWLRFACSFTFCLGPGLASLCILSCFTAYHAWLAIFLLPCCTFRLVTLWSYALVFFKPCLYALLGSMSHLALHSTLLFFFAFTLLCLLLHLAFCSLFYCLGFLPHCAGCLVTFPVQPCIALLIKVLCPWAW